MKNKLRILLIILFLCLLIYQILEYFTFGKEGIPEPADYDDVSIAGPVNYGDNSFSGFADYGEKCVANYGDIIDSRYRNYVCDKNQICSGFQLAVQGAPNSGKFGGCVPSLIYF